MVSIQHHHRHLLGATAEIPPAMGGSGSNHPLTPQDPNFDSNMVIILAALLCALICALGLNSIVRCALRCGVFRLGLHGGAASTAGLNKAALRKIPVEEYRGGGGGEEGGSMEAAECPICLAEFAEGEKVRVLPKCNHGFHVKCVDKWLVSHSSCPTCRQQLLLEQPNPNNNTSTTSTTTSNLDQEHGGT